MHHYAIISPQYHKDILDKSLPVRLFIFLIFFRRRVLYIFIFFRRQVVYIYNILRNFQIFLEYLFINQSQSRTVFSTNHITDRMLYKCICPALQVLFVIKNLERYLVDKSSYNNNIFCKYFYCRQS